MNVIAAILGLLEIFSEVIVGSKCGALARIEKQAISQKMNLLKSFSEIRTTPISSPQLKIKNKIMAYRWTFGKGPLKLEKIS